MKTAVSWVLAALLLGAPLAGQTPPPAPSADPAPRTESPAEADGFITGTVYNNSSKNNLEKADVTVRGTSLRAQTDRDGTFAIPNLPPGTYTLVANYVGLEDLERTVTVAPGETLSVTFPMVSAEALALAEFVVQAEREGEAAAINQQKKSSYLVEEVSADQFGRVTEGNVGEFLKYLPGMQVNYAGTEARTVAIRGQSENIVGVTLDGNPASTSASSNLNRNFEFQQVNIQNLESVQVYKAPPPWMDPNQGGVINLVSKSAFKQRGRRLSFTTALNGNTYIPELEKRSGPTPDKTYKITPAASLQYSEAFLDNRLGVSFSANATSQYNPGSYGATYGYRFKLPGATTTVDQNNPNITESTPGYLSSVNIRDDRSPYTRRNTLALNLDFRLGPGTSLSWKNSYNDYRLTLRTGGLNISAAPNNEPLGGYSFENVSFAPNIDNVANTGVGGFDVITRSWGHNLTFDHEAGPWKFTATGGFSRSTNHYADVNEGTVQGVGDLRASNLGFSVTHPMSAGQPSSLVATGGNNFNDLSNYTFNSLRAQVRNSMDTIWFGRADVKRLFAMRFPLEVRAGYSIREQTRDNESYSKTYYPGQVRIEPNGSMTPIGRVSLGQFGSSGYDAAPINDGLVIPRANDLALANYFSDNPGLWTLDEARTYQAKVTSTRKFVEIQHAGYVAGEMTFGKLNVLTGLRVEADDTEAVGSVRRDSLIPVGVPTESLAAQIARYSQPGVQTDYQRYPIFKNLQLRYNILKDLIARASYYDGFGRVNITDRVPNTSINDSSSPPSVTVVNVGLKPQRSKNYDFALDHYFGPASFVRVGWFRKEIEDYIVSTDSGVPLTEGEFAGYRVITRANAGYAEYDGVELSGTHKLNYLPEPFKGFAVSGAYTNIYDVGGVFGGTIQVQRITGLILTTYNWNLSYSSPNGRFYARFNNNVRDRFLRSTRAGVGAGQERYLDEYNEKQSQYDISLRYNLTRKLALELTGRNISDEPQVFTRAGLVIDYQSFGASYSLAATYSF